MNKEVNNIEINRAKEEKLRQEFLDDTAHLVEEQQSDIVDREVMSITSQTAETSRPDTIPKPVVERTKKSGRPTARAVLAGVALSGIVGAGAATGAFNEADQERDLQNYDAKNKAENVAANPELFGGNTEELGLPQETVVSVDPGTISTGESEAQSK